MTARPHLPPAASPLGAAPGAPTVWATAVWGAALCAAPAAAAAQIALTSPSIAERDARPGESYRGTVVVVNETDLSQRVRVYQTDYRTYADGRSYFDAPGTTARSNAAWVSPARSYVVLPPRGHASLAYAVTVPADSTGASPRTGSYWSLVMVEAEPQGRAAVPGVVTTIRYATQVVTHLVDRSGSGGAARVSVANPLARLATAGGPALQVDIANVGERAAPVALSAELFGPDGTPVGKVRARQAMLYPGSSVRQQFALPALRPGTYRALVVADAGGDEVVGAQYTLTY